MLSGRDCELQRSVILISAVLLVGKQILFASCHQYMGLNLFQRGFGVLFE